MFIDSVEKFERLNKDDQRIALFETVLANGQKCECRLRQCEKQFIKKMIIKGKSLVISKATFYFGVSAGIFLTGAGLFRPEEFFKWVKIILPFM
jgi:hypothetical protein